MRRRRRTHDPQSPHGGRSPYSATAEGGTASGEIGAPLALAGRQQRAHSGSRFAGVLTGKTWPEPLAAYGSGCWAIAGVLTGNARQRLTEAARGPGEHRPDCVKPGCARLAGPRPTESQSEATRSMARIGGPPASAASGEEHEATSQPAGAQRRGQRGGRTPTGHIFARGVSGARRGERSMGTASEGERHDRPPGHGERSRTAERPRRAERGHKKGRRQDERQPCRPQGPRTNRGTGGLGGTPPKAPPVKMLRLVALLPHV